MIRIYLAGPLFTAADRHWNELLVTELDFFYGHEIFLPQSIGQNPNHQEIFEELRNQIIKSDILVANLNGVQVDDGTAWEIGFAVAHDIPVIGFRDDWRDAGERGDTLVNLMIYQSVDEIFEFQRIEYLARNINEYITNHVE